MVEYDPFSQAIMDDPHPIYRAMREEAPAYHLAEYNAWAYSRFDDVWNAAQDPDTYSSAQGTTSAHLLLKNLEVFPALDMMDPPRHTALRSAVRGFFTPGRLKRFETHFRNIVKQRLDVVRESGRFDVVKDLGSHLSTLSVCAVLELPEADSEQLRGWVDAVFSREPGNIGLTEEGIAAYGHLDAYFAQWIARRRKLSEQPPDVLGTFLDTEFEGQRMDDDTAASHMKELVIAGTETLPKMLAATLRRLAEHPEQRAEVIADKSLVLDAFTEAVRLDMPTQFMARLLMRDIELHGQKLRAGSPILLLYPSASRDEREFANADSYDIRRPEKRSVGFGHGTHACLGRHVARLEARVALEEILAVMPDYSVDLAAAETTKTDFVQGFSGLPIDFEPF